MIDGHAHLNEIAFEKAAGKNGGEYAEGLRAIGDAGSGRVERSASQPGRVGQCNAYPHVFALRYLRANGFVPG